MCAYRWFTGSARANVRGKMRRTIRPNSRKSVPPRRFHSVRETSRRQWKAVNSLEEDRSPVQPFSLGFMPRRNSLSSRTPTAHVRVSFGRFDRSLVCSFVRLFVHSFVCLLVRKNEHGGNARTRIRNATVLCRVTG